MNEPPPPPVRLDDLLGVLSLVSDLGMGQPMEHALRQCVIAMRLGERIGLGDHEREAVHYTGLMAWIGCHVDAYEQAMWFGDDMALKADFRTVDFSGTSADMAFMLRHLGTGRSLLERARTAVGFIGGGMKDAEAMLENHWRAADALAESLGLSDLVRKGIEHSFERWDGRGVPSGAKGEEILLTARLVMLADVVEVFHRAGGVEAAVAVAKDRSRTQFDPSLVEAFSAAAPEVLGDLDTSASSWDAVIAADPNLGAALDDDELDRALEAVADFTDVKSPYTLGHSRRVADVTGDAAGNLGLPHGEATAARRAALLHDLGRLGVSNSIWDKGDRLTVAEAERVRLHPYLTERALASSPALAPLAAIAVQHHERLDGSGYPRGLRGDALSTHGRVLACADQYVTKTEPRPYRAAATPAEAASILRAEVRTGRLDGDAVEAVLRAAGHRPRRRRDSVAGLTPREVEVLRLLARGLSNKEIAHRLRISRKTAGNHIERIYSKLGVNNRALAGLFAAKQGLVGPEDEA